MGARGPQKKPTYLRILEGSTHKIKNPAEPLAPTVKALTPPEWFNPDRVRIWNEVCAELSVMNGLSKVDYQMLVLYVDTLSECERQMKIMQDLPNEIISDGERVLRGKWSVSLLNHKKMALAFAAQFGQTPSARARIVQLGKDGDNNGDPFAC